MTALLTDNSIHGRDTGRFGAACPFHLYRSGPSKDPSPTAAAGRGRKAGKLKAAGKSRKPTSKAAKKDTECCQHALEK